MNSTKRKTSKQKLNNMEQNAFIDFIRELITRLGQKSPKFFKVLRIIFAIPTIVVAIPAALKMFNVELPQVFNDTLQKWVSGFAVAGFIMTFFPVKNAEAAAVKEKLPFTKTVSVILILLGFSFCGMSQINFVKPIAKFKKVQTVQQVVGFTSATQAKASQPVYVSIPIDSTFTAFRPKAIAATIFTKGNVELAAGGGLSFQNITQRGSDGRNYVNWDITLAILAGGSVISNIPTPPVIPGNPAPIIRPEDIQKLCLIVTALNGTVGIGGALSRIQDPITLKKKWYPGLALVYTINFNN